MTPEERGPIEDLKYKLDRPDAEPVTLRRTSLSESDSAVPKQWSAAEGASSAAISMPLLKKVLYASIVFFGLMAVVAAWAFFRGDNVIKTGNVELAINAPASARAGEEISLEVTLSNRNNIPLEFVDLIMKYPLGTRLPGRTDETTRERVNLGTLAPGDEQKETFKIVLFGDKGSRVPVEASVEYRLSDSNAIFDKSVVHEVEISDAPLSVTVDIPEQVNSEQDLEIEVTVTSNAKTSIEGAALAVSYPPGFSFKSASDKPSEHNNLWRLPHLSPGETKTISIVGAIAGQDNDQKTFRFEAGIPDEKVAGKLAVLYDAELSTISLSRPNVALALDLNGSTALEQVMNGRELIKGQLRWVNNLPDKLENVEIQLVFDGNALDPLTVAPDAGVFQPQSKTIIWNRASNQKLESIDPGEDGDVRFSFSSSALGSGLEVIKNPELLLEVRFKARQVVAQGDGERKTIDLETTKRLKFNSVVQLAANALYHTDLVPTSGPLPPRVGEETVYAVTWSVVNSSNDLRDAEVQATLPPYMHWVGNHAPGNESLSFDAVESGGGEVTWKLGTVRAGAGFMTAPRQVTFLVGLTPSLAQRDTSPILLSAPTLRAVDVFTNQMVTLQTRRNLDTYIIGDPQYKSGDEKVVE